MNQFFHRQTLGRGPAARLPGAVRGLHRRCGAGGAGGAGRPSRSSRTARRAGCARSTGRRRLQRAVQASGTPRFPLAPTVATASDGKDGADGALVHNTGVGFQVIPPIMNFPESRTRGRGVWFIGAGLEPGQAFTITVETGGLDAELFVSTRGRARGETMLEASSWGWRCEATGRLVCRR